MIDHPQGGRMFVAPRRANRLALGTASSEYGELDTATFIEEMHAPAAPEESIYVGRGTSSTVFIASAIERRLLTAALTSSTVSMESDELEALQPALRVASEISGSHRSLATQALSYPHFSLVEVRLTPDPED